MSRRHNPLSSSHLNSGLLIVIMHLYRPFLILRHQHAPHTHRRSESIPTSSNSSICCQTTWDRLRSTRSSNSIIGNLTSKAKSHRQARRPKRKPQRWQQQLRPMISSRRLNEEDHPSPPINHCRPHQTSKPRRRPRLRRPRPQTRMPLHLRWLAARARTPGTNPRPLCYVETFQKCPSTVLSRLQQKLLLQAVAAVATLLLTGPRPDSTFWHPLRRKSPAKSRTLPRRENFRQSSSIHRARPPRLTMKRMSIWPMPGRTGNISALTSKMSILWFLRSLSSAQD